MSGKGLVCATLAGILAQTAFTCFLGSKNNAVHGDGLLLAEVKAPSAVLAEGASSKKRKGPY